MLRTSLALLAVTSVGLAPLAAQQSKPEGAPAAEAPKPAAKPRDAKPGATTAAAPAPAPAPAITPAPSRRSRSQQAASATPIPVEATEEKKPGFFKRVFGRRDR